MFLNFSETTCLLNTTETGTCQLAVECDFFKQIGLFFAEKFGELKIRESQCISVSSKHICCEMKQINNIDITSSTQVSTTITSTVPTTSSPPVSSTEISEMASTTVSSRVSENALEDKFKYFNLNSCGIITKDKIANGNLTSIKEYPWVALLEYEVLDGNPFLCGGTLINGE